MSRPRFLKALRAAASLAVAGLLCAAFTDLWGAVPAPVTAFFTWFQFVPSLSRVMASFGWMSLGFLVVLAGTLLLGRAYCSFLCPLGAFMDLTLWVRKKIRKKRFHYRKPGALRYVILASVILTVLGGSMTLVQFLDPFSVFGRTAQAIVRPGLAAANNTLALAGEKTGIYFPDYHPVIAFSWGVFGFAAAWLFFVTFMAWTRGRLYCNMVCPVGALLGLAAKAAPVAMRMDAGKCTGCGLCERVCKASCIDVEKASVDAGRCVVCFDCLGVCPVQALDYTRKAQQALPSGLEARRNFLAASLLFLLAIPARAWGRGAEAAYSGSTAPVRAVNPITPPGSLGVEHFTKHCTGCHLCVASCPSQVIQPGLFTCNEGGFLAPGLSYGKGFCNYNCNVCSTVCPAGAILPVGMEEKKRVQMGQAQFVRQNCVVITEKKPCVACAEHCPTGAVKINKQQGLGVPEVNSEVCVGCGACEFACPARPYKAIYVEGAVLHQTAKPPVKEKPVTMDAEADFPF